MNIARPVNGFKFSEKPIVQETLNTARPSCPWLDLAYANVVHRLRMAGHRTGFSVNDNLSYRIYVEADPDTKVNRLAISYHVLGDALTILAIKVLVGGEAGS